MNIRGEISLAGSTIPTLFTPSNVLLSAYGKCLVRSVYSEVVTAYNQIGPLPGCLFPFIVKHTSLAIICCLILLSLWSYKRRYLQSQNTSVFSSKSKHHSIFFALNLHGWERAHVTKTSIAFMIAGSNELIDLRVGVTLHGCAGFDFPNHFGARSHPAEEN